MAEMGSAMLCAETDIDSECVFDNCAAYLGSWLDTIKGDPRWSSRLPARPRKQRTS